MKYLIILAIAIIAIIFGPFITIWSLNTLFPALAIPYTLETWAATIALHATVRGLFVKAK